MAVIHSLQNSLVCVKQAKREASLLCLGCAQWDYCYADEKCSVFNTVEKAKKKNHFQYCTFRENWTEWSLQKLEVTYCSVVLTSELVAKHLTSKWFCYFNNIRQFVSLGSCVELFLDSSFLYNNIKCERDLSISGYHNEKWIESV